MKPGPADILAMGLVTPVGLDASSAAAALRAGVSRVRESALLDKLLEPLRIGLIPDDLLPELPARVNVASRTFVHVRMLRIAALALEQAIHPARGEAVPLFLGVPEARPGAADPVGESFLADLAALQESACLLLAASRLHREGGAAGLFALRAALDWLAGGRGDLALAGAVDSYLDPWRLATLDAEKRLLTAGESDGFLPGEGAAFLLLATPAGVARLGRAPLARVLAAATGEEPGHRDATAPNRGDGLAAAIGDTLAAAPSAPPVRCVYAGFNGESFPAKEWGVAYLRSSDRFERECRIEHPADCIGDAGAALGLIMLAAAATGLTSGYRASPCLVWSTSDRSPRAAALLATARPPG